MAAPNDWENNDPSVDKEMSFPTYEIPLPFKPACWPTTLAHVPLLNPKTHMSSLRYTTPAEFPPILPTPNGPPSRVQPQLPALRSLDKDIPISKILRGGNESEAQAESCCQDIRNPHDRGYDSAQDETRNKAALKQLEAHIKERGPYVHLASSRLQAAMRMRNTLPFNLPQPSISKPIPALNAMRLASAGMYTSSDSGAKTMLEARDRSGSRASAKSVKKSMKMYTVDQETGKGLREFLLAKGKELGHKKRVCKSISIHDFTPDIRTLAYQNVLLAHYDAEIKEGVTTYEVDL